MSETRDPVVDLLRGVAIGVVLLLHFSLTYRLAASPLGDLLSPAALRAVVNNGNFGVTIFFAVSGFLITSNVLRREGRLADVDIGAFYLRRAARILPPLLLAVSVITALGLAGAPSFTNRVDGVLQPNGYFLVAAGSVLTFTHNMLMQSAGYFNYCLNIYWSLSVEEMFYLAFPLLCFASAKRGWMVVALCVAAAAIGPLYRHAHVDDEIFYMYGYPACFDAIAFGCLAALAAARQSVSVTVARLGVAAAAALLALSYLSGIKGNEVFGFTAVALSTALLLFFNASLARPSRVGSVWSAPLRWAGRHSYELYLFHIVVLALMRDALPRDQLGYDAKLPWLLCYLLLSAVVAGLVARHLSEPANASIRRRFFASRTRPCGAGAATAPPGPVFAGREKEVS
ncbi:MAG: acyltransferase [Burkholderiales bacterium]|nr:acyltransferase [Burkholderiales bacterium]